MPIPDFTPDEQYLIDSLKSPGATRGSSSQMWGYVISGAIIAAFAAYYASVPMMLCAFAVVCGFRIYEERYQRKWMPIWRSLIEKYEAAVTGSDSDVER